MVAKSVGEQYISWKKQSPRINVHCIAADMRLISLTQMSLVNGESDLATVLHGNTLVSSWTSLQAPD